MNFNQATQKEGEKIEEWAERVLQLATAFESAPGVGMSSRDTAVMVRKFCTSSSDKDAGLHAAIQHPETLNGAIHQILRYQLNPRDV